MKSFLKSALSISLASALHAQDAPQKPNIIFILADDMGVGDVSHNGGKAATPHIDALAKQGMRFTDAHSSSSVCTPTRYSCLTGRYNWRTRLEKFVFLRPSELPLIKTDEPTIGSILQDNGYHTACVGKWHLGIGWQFLKDYKKEEHHEGAGWDIDYTKPAITPQNNGFHYFYGITASLDMAPYVYIENDKATDIPTVVKAFHRPGAAAADFEADQCLITFAEKSVAYINERATAKEKAPFFLYLPLTSPHTPIVPSKEFLGKSDIGVYGDFLMETDWVVGQVLEALEKNKLTDNTLIIFTTDNGCSPQAKIPNLMKLGHSPSGKLRGHKADIYEGGHRVPFIVKWPGHIKPDTVTSRLTCQTDITATVAEIIDHHIEPHAAVDSVSFLNTLKDETKTERSPIVHHSISGAFAIRSGKWKLAFCKGSGGWSAPRPGKAAKDAPDVQLFDLETDLGEQKNLALEMPEKVKELTLILEKYIKDGRSNPGYPQLNDRKVEIYLKKKKKNAKKKNN